MNRSKAISGLDGWMDWTGLDPLRSLVLLEHLAVLKTYVADFVFFWRLFGHITGHIKISSESGIANM